MSTSVAGKPYLAIWPLPGGAGRYLDTLERVLDWIDSHPNATGNEVLSWFRYAYKLRDVSSAEQYLNNSLRQMGYLITTNETIGLTSAGKYYLQTKSKEFVLGGYLSECRGAWEVLDAVRRLGLASTDMIRGELQSQFHRWKASNQFQYRLDWLFSLSCLEKMGAKYRITAYGEQALRNYKGPGPISIGPMPSLPKKPEVATTPSFPLLTESSDVAPEQAVEPSRRSTPATLLDELITEIKRTALASDEATDFERALTKAFDYLGFQATHKSGPGDTDILLTASLGHDTYRTIVDGKSSKHGKIGTAAVNWSALNKHRQANNAHYILVAAPGFSSGDLYNYAKETEAALITAQDLCEILRLHDETPFSLTELRDLFSYPGEPERPLQQMKEKHNEISRLQQLISETIEALGRYGGEPVSAEGLYYILREIHKDKLYKRSEIEEALVFLQSPFIGALDKVDEHRFVLKMTKETILRRLQAQART